MTADPDEEEMWLSAPSPALPEEFSLGVHLSRCLMCSNAPRWSAMCNAGKTLYDDMTAAQYAANRKEESGT